MPTLTVKQVQSSIKNKKNKIEKTQKIPIPVHVPAPTYPLVAQLNETSGYAIIAFTITKKGKVKDLALIKESLIQFGKSAMKAAKGLRYDPILLNGKPQEVRSSYKYIFKVER
ncbi:MAG: energy transducer TonB [Porticoccaceae bacterium]